MALFQCSLYSETLMTNINVNVLLPIPDAEDYVNQDLYGYKPGARFQTLYLLHGAYGDATDWLRNTRIAQFAQRARVAVVMACAGNSFYMDMGNGSAYAQFFEGELPMLMEGTFPLAQRREDRFIAGLSMGGYGALRIALRNPQRYCAAVGLSGAYDLEETWEALEVQREGRKAAFEELACRDRGDWELANLAKRALQSGETLPKLMVSCGTEDFTLEMNRRLRDSLEVLGISLDYQEHPGAHNWDYWETHIQTALRWLPLKRRCV